MLRLHLQAFGGRSAFLDKRRILLRHLVHLATVDAPSASWLACYAFSAFCLTVELNCSMDAAVSSSAEACSSVRWLRS